MNAEQLLETTMDPENRTLLKVMAEDEATASEMFVTLMGDSGGSRARNSSRNTRPARTLISRRWCSKS